MWYSGRQKIKDNTTWLLEPIEVAANQISQINPECTEREQNTAVRVDVLFIIFWKKCVTKNESNQMKIHTGIHIGKFDSTFSKIRCN